MGQDILGLQKERLARKKAKIEAREKLLKVKERQFKIRKFIELGELVCKTGLHVLDTTTMLGAFVEIQEKSNEHETLKSWAIRGQHFLEKEQASNNLPLIISFETDPPTDIKNTLKGLKFKWNAFRREWYGYGKKDRLEELLKAFKTTIETSLP